MKKRTMLCAMLAVITALCLGLFLNTNTSVTMAFADEAHQPTVQVAITEQTGLGLAINVLTAESYSDYSTGYSVLKPQWVTSQSANRINVSSNISNTNKVINSSEFLTDFSLNLKSGVSVENKALLAAAARNIEREANFSFANYSFKYFANLSHTIKKYRLYLTNYLDKSTYANAFSTDFLADVQKVKNGTMTAETLLNRYGTHIVGSAIYGGKLNATFTLASNKIVIGGNIKKTIDTTVSFTDPETLTTGEIYNAIKGQLSSSTTQNDLRSNFRVEATGGSFFASGTPSLFVSNYPQWANSFNASDASCVTVDYGNDGLVAIWDILPDTYQSVANSLKSKFIEKYNSSYNAFTEKFKTGDYENFAGGVGDSAYPYLLKTVVHLRNIEKNMSAHYKMLNSISLSGTDWVPLGGTTNSQQFKGSLNGNSYYITNLSKTSNAAEVSNRYYYGFFGSIGSGAVIDSLNFSNVNIKITGTNSSNSSSRVFIGALAGANYGGTVKNCTVSGTCSYDVCVAGATFTGGLCGIARNSTFVSCTNRANVTSGRYTSGSGGIVGYSRKSTYSECKNTATIKSICTKWWGYSFAGGIIGADYESDRSTIANCNGGNNSNIIATDYGNGPKSTLQKGLLRGGFSTDNIW